MPAYNEEACIGPVVEQWLAEARRVGGARLLVVDDGSRDSTSSVLAALARVHPDLTVISQANAGHGAAVLRAYREALAAGCEWVFQTDSDDQFDAADFDRLWRRRDEAPFLLGWRAARQDAPTRIHLSRTHALLLRALFGVSLRDPNVPFRLMRASLLKRYLDLIPPGVFAPNVFLSVLAARDGLLPDQIAVNHRRRDTGAGSIHGWKTLKTAARCLREYFAFRSSLGDRGGRRPAES